MRTISRLTIQYDDDEDRIRFLGAVGDETIVLWFTQRLLNRLVPLLCQRLEPTGGDRKLEAINSFAQMAAIETLGSTPAVQSNPQADTILVREVTVTSRSETVQMVMKPVPGDKEGISITLSNDELRQWLAILRGQYQKGGWAMSIWPAWVAGQSPQSEAITPIRH